MQKRSGKKKNFLFFFFFKKLNFSKKSARVSSVFRTFPNLQKPAKTFKNTFSTSIFGLLVHNSIKHNIYTYTFIQSSNIQNFFNSMHSFIKRLGLSRTYADHLRTSSTEDQSPRSSFSKYIHIYIYIYEKIFNIYNMQNIYTMQSQASSPRWLDSLRRGMLYRRTCLMS